MDTRISGSGSVSAGEYENIKISGSGRLQGFVRCESLHVSGSCHGERLECKKDVKVSGSGKFDGDVSANSISVSGYLSCNGSARVAESLGVSGGMKCSGDIRCGRISVSGSLISKADIEAEDVRVSGLLDCDGLLNAENVDIEISNGMKIENIGGSNITIQRSDSFSGFRLNLFSTIVNKNAKRVLCDSIEGDVIAIEYVRAKRVSGRTVAIGDGCDIELVQYSNEIEISPKANVGRSEKK